MLPMLIAAHVGSHAAQEVASRGEGEAGNEAGEGCNELSNRAGGPFKLVRSSLHAPVGVLDDRTEELQCEMRWLRRLFGRGC